MTEDYAVRRKEYVEEIRRSFDKESSQNVQKQEIKTDVSSMSVEWMFFKVRAVLALFIMIIFLLCQFYHYSIYGLSTEELREQVSNDRYDIFLSEFIQSLNHF